MDSTPSKKEKSKPTDSEPIPDLNYDEPYERSLFQQACVDFTGACAFTDHEVSEWTVGGENHVGIPLLGSHEVKSIEINEEATYFGVLIGPRGLYQNIWGNENASWFDGLYQFLRHPAELADIRTAYAGKPFSLYRSELPDTFTSPEKYAESILSKVPSYEAELTPQYPKRQARLDEMLEGIYILLEESPFTGQLLPISNLSKCKEGRELLNNHEVPITGYVSYGKGLHCPYSSLRFIEECSWEGDLSEFNKKANNLACNFEDSLVSASYHDVVLGYASETTSLQLLGGLNNNSRRAPKLVVRPNRETITLTRFLDLLANNTDISSILKKPASWKKAAKQQKFEIECDVKDQARASISLRRCIEDYVYDVSQRAYHPPGEVRSLDQIERHIHSLQQAYYTFQKKGCKDILRDPDPRLPHFLEIAYQRLVESSSEKTRSAHSRNLISLLGRSILYFMLEDLSAAGITSDLIDKINQELHGKKLPSDGRLLSLQNTLIKSIPSDQREPLVTEHLMEEVPKIIKDHLLPLVEKRNRANHPPFDEDGFLQEVDKQIPQAITALRNAFRSLELLVPVHFKTDKDGELVVTAISLTGNHFEYPENDLLTDLSHEKTPTETLLLCHVSPSQSKPTSSKNQNRNEAHHTSPPATTSKQETSNIDVEKASQVFVEINELITEADRNMKKSFAPRIYGAVPLQKYFNTKYGYKKMIMTGVFDRIDKGEPVFEYIEE